MKYKGFTVVELLIVIVVIGILASITIVSYSNMRNDAMDTKIKTTVKTVGDAITLYESKSNVRPSGEGYFTVPSGVDALTPTHLKTGYRDGITGNKVGDPAEVFRWYNCGDSFVVYASLNNPSADDISNFKKIKTVCSHSDAQAPESGAQVYNYAQMF